MTAMSLDAPNHLPGFLSPAPTVKLVNSFERPFDNAVATARTCYSAKGLVTTAQVAGDGLDEAAQEERRSKRDDLARSIYKAGHHTTLQHAHFQFALTNDRGSSTGRSCTRILTTTRTGVTALCDRGPGPGAVPLDRRLTGTVPRHGASQMAAYQRLTEALKPAAEGGVSRPFKGADLDPAKTQQAVQKKAQEAARYVLPVATFAYLYHTVSGLTLLRYWRMCEAFDAPLEQRLVVGGMVAEMLRVEPGYRALLEHPLEREATLEVAMWNALRPEEGTHRAFREEFDASLGGRASLLVDWSDRAEGVLADAAREVLGVPARGVVRRGRHRLGCGPPRGILTWGRPSTFAPTPRSRGPCTTPITSSAASSPTRPIRRTNGIA
jgi:hypothetical protein